MRPNFHQAIEVYLEFQKAEKQMPAKPIVDYFQRVCDATLCKKPGIGSVDRNYENLKYLLPPLDQHPVS